MTKHFRDDEGRRWKAWLASREVFWPDPGKSKKAPKTELESVLFVCFSDPNQPQKRLRLPAGSFEEMEPEDLKRRFKKARPDPAIR